MLSSPEQVQTFEREGAVVPRDLVTEQAIEAMMKCVGGGLVRRGNPLDSHHDVDLPCPAVEGICGSPGFRATAEELCGTQAVFTHGAAFVQAPGGPGVRWHFDVYSFNFLRPADRAWSLWIPLTPIRPSVGSGGMEYADAAGCEAVDRGLAGAGCIGGDGLQADYTASRTAAPSSKPTPAPPAIWLSPWK
ncbi:MAG: hypothetical protein CMJ84_15060 [Planctomycetes bacterium]|jgi:hypothetical protein|nr:hypothetical protein [Planctomycetota bacterium]MDP6410207.1 hypothetical protein [Planctomycetota bacterium]